MFFGQSINSTLLETNFGGDSEPDHLTKIGNKIYFSASVYNDRELYIKGNLSRLLFYGHNCYIGTSKCRSLSNDNGECSSDRGK